MSLDTATPVIVYPYHEATVTETTWHYKAIEYLHMVLVQRYREQENVFVGANNFIYWEEGNTDEKQSPDVYVCFGARNTDRSSYMTWNEGGIAPQVVFEISSKGSRITDLGTKKAVYEMLGVEEYYVFDPLVEYIPSGLRAFRLQRGAFVEVPESAARIRPKGRGKIRSTNCFPPLRVHSPRLGLDVGTEGPLLRLYLPGQVEGLPTYQEASQRLNDAEEAQQQAEEARRRAEERLAQLESENAELRRKHGPSRG